MRRSIISPALCSILYLGFKSGISLPEAMETLSCKPVAIDVKPAKPASKLARFKSGVEILEQEDLLSLKANNWLNDKVLVFLL